MAPSVRANALIGRGSLHYNINLNIRFIFGRKWHCNICGISGISGGFRTHPRQWRGRWSHLKVSGPQRKSTGPIALRMVQELGRSAFSVCGWLRACSPGFGRFQFKGSTQLRICPITKPPNYGYPAYSPFFSQKCVGAQKKLFFF